MASAHHPLWKIECRGLLHDAVRESRAGKSVDVRRRSAGLVATCGGLIALLVTACGSVEETREAEKPKAAPQTTPSTRTDVVADAGEEVEGREETAGAEDAGASWTWVSVGWSASSDSSESNAPDLADQLAVFSRPRRPADAVPRDAPELASNLEAFEGEARLDESRLAIANAGNRNVDVYLVPTTKGFVCKYIVDPTDEVAEGFGGCDHALAQEGYTVEISGTEHRLEVEGLIEDSVQRVEVELWGRPVEAEVAGNAYYLDTTVEKSCPTAVGAIVLHSSGGARRIELDHPTEPPAAGATFRIPGCR
jgi:hypothetical protein